MLDGRGCRCGRLIRRSQGSRTRGGLGSGRLGGCRIGDGRGHHPFVADTDGVDREQIILHAGYGVHGFQYTFPVALEGYFQRHGSPWSLVGFVRFFRIVRRGFNGELGAVHLDEFGQAAFRQFVDQAVDGFQFKTQRGGRLNRGSLGAVNLEAEPGGCVRYENVLFLAGGDQGIPECFQFILECRGRGGDQRGGGKEGLVGRFQAAHGLGIAVQFFFQLFGLDFLGGDADFFVQFTAFGIDDVPCRG